MMSSVFRPSIDLYELLLISRNCIKQGEKLAKQRARLSAQRRRQRELRCKRLKSRTIVGRVSAGREWSEIIWCSNESSASDKSGRCPRMYFTEQLLLRVGGERFDA